VLYRFLLSLMGELVLGKLPVIVNAVIPVTV